MLLSDLHEDQLSALLGESICQLIVDSGCNKTVCGELWLNLYLDTLSIENRKLVSDVDSVEKFKFGDGNVYSSVRCVNIPVYLGTDMFMLKTYVVRCNIPCLLSKESIKTADGFIDFKNDSVYLFDRWLSLNTSTSGHYLLPVYKLHAQSSNHVVNHVNNVMMSAPDLSDGKLLMAKVRKLHKQFAHPMPKKLKKLLSDAGLSADSIMSAIDAVSENCEVCKRYKRPPLRPVVCFPLASTFNETVAMDIKWMCGHMVLHMIDHLSRYGQAVVVKNKRKETIVKAIMENWVRIFGSPGKFLSDNGGEFVNDELIEFAEKFNITIKTTGAESAWSNGLCEKHNGILADKVSRIISDNTCGIELAVHWGVAAKNALSNVYGFSPNQLVFGRNTNFPSVHYDRPPAQNVTCVSKYMSDNLLALHKAREAFIQQESCERLRRALNRQTRTYSDIVYTNGDKVLYKRRDSDEYHGPAVVLGKDSASILLKHGGSYVRVHPCRMQPFNSDPDIMNPVETPVKTLPVVEQSVSSTNKTSPITTSSNPDDEDDVDEDMPTSHLPITPPATPAFPEHQNIMNNFEEPENNGVEHDDQDKELMTPNLRSSGNDSIQEYPDTEPYGYAESPPQPEFGTPPEPEFMTPPQPEFMTPPEKPSKVPLSLARLLDHNKPGKLESPDQDTEEVLIACRECSSSNPRFDEAKQQEIQKWRDLDAFVEVEDIGQPRISCRFVCTEKIKAGKMSLKARLVARGFEENVSELRTDSPTCQKESLRCFLSILAAKNWQLSSIDIKSAYLQGIPINREVHMKPPKEADTTKLWLLKKCPYGLADAGRLWYLKVKKELLGLGGTQMSTDQAVFLWFDSNNVLIGIMVIHVDDFIFGGDRNFHDNVILQFRSRFIVGSEESTAMKYIGVEVQQTLSGISMSTNSYCSGLQEIDTTGLGKDRKRKLSESEITSLKKVSGQLNWVVNQTRLDCAFDSCLVANSCKEATVQDIHVANKAIRKVRGQKVFLKYPSTLELSSCRIITFCDASYANLPDRGSQGSYVILLCDRNGIVCVLDWQSRRIRRVVNSTLAAECLAATEAAKSSLSIQFFMTKALGSERPSVPITMLCDNKSLVDAVHSSTSVEDKRLQIDVSMLREMISTKDIEEFRWIPTNLQLANCLTKNGSSTQYLLDVIRLGKVFIYTTGEFF